MVHGNATLKKGWIPVLVAYILFFSCNSKNSFDIKEFDPFSNFQVFSDTLYLDMDLSEAASNGIIIPSNIGKNRFFIIRFLIRNNTHQPRKYFYKLFYQNESYKFCEFISDSAQQRHYNPESSSNFYGSWSGSDNGFHVTRLIPADGDLHEVLDSFRILGNPRNEKKYFGSRSQIDTISTAEIEETISRIKSSAEWMKHIKEKARRNKKEMSEQVYLDALWTIEHDRNKGNVNNRWKRNPRTGVYRFLLVVAEEGDLDKMPPYIRDISKKDSISDTFQNPFYYFLHHPERLDNLEIVQADQCLQTKARLDFSKCMPDSLFFQAPIEQYFRELDPDYMLENIPLIFDVVKDNYTREAYQFNAARFQKKELVRDFVKFNSLPIKTAGFDSTIKAMFIKNPGNAGDFTYKKVNAGIRTRIGFTYGKFRAKIKFPEVLSNDNVWNGLTCAFWLHYQEGEWNNRSACESGYLPKSSINNQGDRVKTSNYSEIDIEIVKTSKYWPEKSYRNSEIIPFDDGINGNMVIACTNWDLACHDPVKFNVGVQPIQYLGHEFYLHRWDDWYKALTSKYEIPETESLGRILYYEIEWKPECIIWRMGPDKNDMQVIGYMDSHHTQIPDNQMIAVVSQEFHDASWWPTAPFKQEYIPFPKNDIIGYIYEIEIE